jgi:hypothetical protein
MQNHIQNKPARKSSRDFIPNLDNIYIGLICNSFSNLCNLIGIKPQAGDSRDAQKKELSRHIEWKEFENSNKLEITDIFVPPLPKEDSKQTKIYQNSIFYSIFSWLLTIKQPINDGEFYYEYITKQELFLKLGLHNKHFKVIMGKNFINSYTEIEKYLICIENKTQYNISPNSERLKKFDVTIDFDPLSVQNQFYFFSKRANKYLNKVLTRALNDIHRKTRIRVTETYLIREITATKEVTSIKEAADTQVTLIHDARGKVLAEMGCKHAGIAFIKGRYIEFLDKVADELALVGIVYNKKVIRFAYCTKLIDDFEIYKDLFEEERKAMVNTNKEIVNHLTQEATDEVKRFVNLLILIEE